MNKLLCISLLFMVASGGCIPSTPLEEGELDRYWSLTADPTSKAERHQPVFGEVKLPSRWVIRRQKSVIISTISLVRAYDKMKTGAETIEFSISPTHTKAVVNLLGEARQMIHELSELAESADRLDSNRWAKTIAGALVHVEHITRLTSIEGEGAGDEEPLGLSAGPMMQMLAMYLNERSGGALLGELDPNQIHQVRAVMSQIVLRLGFDMAARQLPQDLRDTVTEIMRQADRLDTLESSLTDLISREVSSAPPATQEGKFRKVFRIASAAAPRALKLFEALINQWDRVDQVELEYLQLDGKPVFAATVTVLPGKEVRIANVIIGQPTAVLRGKTRMLAIPDSAPAGEMVLLFESEGDGAVEQRFEGFIYSMVRLFGFPLADSVLREIRVFTHTTKQGRQLVHLAVFSEAIGDKKDPRRLLVFQDVREKKILRKAFSIDSVSQTSRQSFSYITPTRRYTYLRSRGDDE